MKCTEKILVLQIEDDEPSGVGVTLMRVIAFVFVILHFLNAVLWTVVAAYMIRKGFDVRMEAETRHHVYFFYFGLLTSSCATFMGITATIKKSSSLSFLYIIVLMSLSSFNLIGASYAHDPKVHAYKILIHLPELVILMPIYLIYSCCIKGYEPDPEAEAK